MSIVSGLFVVATASTGGVLRKVTYGDRGLYEVPAAEHKAPCAKMHQAVDGLGCLRAPVAVV